MTPQEFLNALDDMELQPIQKWTTGFRPNWNYVCGNLAELAETIRAKEPIQFGVLDHINTGVVECKSYGNAKVALRNITYGGAWRYDVAYRTAADDS